jgi:hypothetical protein
VSPRAKGGPGEDSRHLPVVCVCGGDDSRHLALVCVCGELGGAAALFFCAAFSSGRGGQKAAQAPLPPERGGAADPAAGCRLFGSRRGKRRGERGKPARSRRRAGTADPSGRSEAAKPEQTRTRVPGAAIAERLPPAQPLQSGAAASHAVWAEPTHCLFCWPRRPGRAVIRERPRGSAVVPVEVSSVSCWRPSRVASVGCGPGAGVGCRLSAARSRSSAVVVPFTTAVVHGWLSPGV